MSKLVKSSQIIIDKKKYVLNNEFFVPVSIEEKDTPEIDPGHSEDQKKTYDDELRLMKEDMLEAVKVESDRMKSEADEERTSIIQQAYDQSSNVLEKARKEGYDAGFQEGVANGYGEATQLIEEALETKDKYFEKYKNIKIESEKALTEIIIQTVEKILNKHVEEDYDVVTGLVESALQKCAFTSNLALRVSPDDYDNAISIKRYILSLTENVEDIEIKQDNALPPGSCVIDTDAGSIDSSVHTQFENVRTKFLELLQSE